MRSRSEGQGVLVFFEVQVGLEKVGLGGDLVLDEVVGVLCDFYF